MTADNKKRGPEPERVKIDDDWESAVGKALHKKRPKEGWPKPEKEEKGERKECDRNAPEAAQ